MKLKISKEWMMAMAEKEGDHEIGAASPEIVAKARALATARGHKNVDEEIVCEGGARRPVWYFYLEQAALG